jgi:CRP-like cAMP-binding protein
VNLQSLRNTPLFEGLSDQELKHLMESAHPVSIRAGEPLMTQGDTGDCAYVVLDGGFEIQKQSGQSIIKIDVRKPGEIIGEMALLSDSPRAFGPERILAASKRKDGCTGYDERRTGA